MVARSSRTIKRKRRTQTGTRTKRAKMSRGYTRPSGYYGRFQMYSGETRFFDGNGTDTSIATSGDIEEDSLHHVAAGTGESNRVGRKITITSLHMRGNVYLPTTSNSGETSDVFRLVIYLDRHANGATAAVTDILETADVFSFRNLVNSDRFKILHDKTITIDQNAGAGNGTTNTFGPARKVFKVNKRLNIPVQFNSTTGAMAEIQANNIGFMAISEAGYVNMNYYWRIRFKEN